MSGNRAVLDSNILIYLSKGVLKSDFLDQFSEILISRITFMEVLGYSFTSEEDERLVRSFLAHFEIIELDEAISEVSIKLRKEKKLKLPDAIIYASAEVTGAILVTADKKDFALVQRGVEIMDPFN